MGKAGPAFGGLVAGLVIGALIGIQIEKGSGPDGGGSGTATAVTPPASASTAQTPTAPNTGETPTPPDAPSTATGGTAGAPPGGHDGPEGPEGPEGPGGTADPGKTGTPGEKVYDHPDHVKGARIVRGRVVAEDAIPVAGAWVTAAVDYRPAAEAICDKNGEFVMVVPGTMAISIRARARRTSESQTEEIDIEAGATVTVVLTVRDAGTLKGRVISSGGDPVKGAKVTVEWVEPEDGDPPLNAEGEPDVMEQRETTSDPQGRFQVPFCYPGSSGGHFLIKATHRNHHPQTVRFDVPDNFRLPDPFGVQLTLIDAGGFAKSTLVNEQGTPIKAAHVMALIRSGRQVTEWKRFDVVDGEFEVKMNNAGLLVITPMVNNKAGIPVKVGEVEPGKVAEGIKVVYKPAPPLLTGKLIPPPGGGLLETQFALEITSGKVTSPVRNPPVKFDPVSGTFTFPRQFYGIEGGAAYGTLSIKAPGCKVKIVDFNAYDGETEDLGDVQLEGE